jgi:hypothetical protein
MSVLDGPGEGTWSVFAMKVVEERDEARAELATAKAEIEALKYPRSYLPPGEERTEALLAITISQAEERGARWALEEAGHGLFNQTRDDRARDICDAARKFEAKLGKTP